MQWEEDWLSASVVNQHLVCDPTIQQPGFDLPRQSWTLPNFSGQTRAHVVLTCTNGVLQHLNSVTAASSRVADHGSHRRFVSANATRRWSDETTQGR